MASHSHSTIFSYNFLQVPGRNYEGDAHSYLGLTETDASGNPVQHSYGRIIHSDPVQLWLTPNEKADFETTVKFIPSSSDDNPAAESNEVNYECDLSCVLPQKVQVGLAGDLVAKQDVSFWVFSSTLAKNGA